MEYIAITGSNGFIGSVLAKHCKERGYGVIGVDWTYGSKGSDISYNNKYVDVAIAGCISGQTFASMCLHYKVSKVFHLAASADVESSERIPFHFYNNNVGNTAAMLHNLINSGWLNRNPLIVYSSTAAVYRQSDSPVKESSPKGSPNAYGRSKLMSEKLLEELFKYFKVPSTTFRYFNVAGARGDVGDRPNTNHIIPVLCRSIINSKPFDLFGIDHNTQDGTCVRDYIDVNDVCRAHFTAVDYMSNNKDSHIFNLGTQKGTSLLQLIREFEDTIKVDLVFNVADKRLGDPPFLVADPNKFINDTGFEYSSNLQSMIESCWQYYLKISEDKNAI